MDKSGLSEEVDFDDLSPKTNELLRRRVVAYRASAADAEELLRQAPDESPDELAAYFCTYKIYTYRGNNWPATSP
jgi:hypothetical protein